MVESNGFSTSEAGLTSSIRILDTDTIVKCFYGHQQGARTGYNPP